MTLGLLVVTPATGHDIPNARVDRATQVTLAPGRLRVDYEVSLSELTLTQELRTLIGHLPGADREDWFASYGRETGPLNARGFLVTVDGEELALQAVGFDRVVEEHPRYTFHLEAVLPPQGRLTVHDTNFTSSEGTSRLALRGVGVAIEGSTVPNDVTTIVPRPIWQLSDQEERDTRFVATRFRTLVAGPAEGPRPARPTPPQAETRGREGLAGLLDSAASRSWVWLALVAGFLGAAHGLLPGHGKTLMAAAVLGDRGGGLRVVSLALVTTVAHLASVGLIAAGFWWTSSTRFGAWDQVISRSAGFVIAVVAFWRLGRWAGGFPILEHDHGPSRPTTLAGLIALGVAGGAMPCWDAVALVIFAEAVGRLGLALGLVLAFSVGLGLVLTVVGLLATRLRTVTRLGSGWARGLQAASRLVLSALGLYLLYRPG
jgi:ABC-type nickel/cobalt efflux system permease component RcnA